MQDDSRQPEVLLEDEALRDGLQMETRIFSLAEKRKIFDLLRRAGVPRVQVGSFVHPKIVPQMADTDRLIADIGACETPVVSALILNSKGLERAMECGVAHVSMSVSVSDTHSRKNARQPADEALAAMTRLIGEAIGAGLKVRAGLQCVFGCVYEGDIDPDVVRAATEKMLTTGVGEINLADTTGMADPLAVGRMVRTLCDDFPQTRFSLHLHDTRGLGLANMFAGYEAGIRSFDVCAGGLGGCPFVKGAAGNVATEDAANMFAAMGVDTGIDMDGICAATALLEQILERPLPGRMKRVLACEKQKR